MNKICIFLLASLFLHGCMAPPPKKEMSKDQLIDLVTKKAAIQIQKKSGLQPCGFGGQAMYQVQMLHLGFRYSESISIEKARRLLVDAVDTFTASVNEEPRIHPHLGNYPFTPKNIEISIYSQGPTASNQLVVADALEGMFLYKVEGKDGCLQTLYQETYAEAKEAASKSPL